MLGGSFSDLDRQSFTGLVVHYPVFNIAADRGKSDLPESGGEFRGPACYLGADGGKRGRQPVRNFGNAVFHPSDFVILRTASGERDQPQCRKRASCGAGRG